jgi:hypothetical protein
MSVLIGWPIKNTLTTHGKKMNVKEIYVMFIHLFDSGILFIIDLNKKKGGIYLWILQLNKYYVSTV